MTPPARGAAPPCTRGGCSGSIVDGYCDVCGLAPAAAAGPDAEVPADPADAPSAISRSATSGLGAVPLGSSRTPASPASRPTRRLGSATASSRLGAGLTHVPPVPEIDPRQLLLDPPTVAEEKRFCAACNAPVGRGRDGQPGRTKGFCAKCRTPFDFDPTLRPGMLLGGQYEIVGCLAHGGMGWIYLARDRNLNDRWVVVKGLLNAGDPDAARAAVAEKQFLAEVEHPLIVEIYNFVAAPDGTSYIVMEYVGGRSLNQILKDRMAANGGVFSGIPVDQAIAYMVEILPAFSYLHGLGLLYCDFKPANVIQVGDSLKLIDLGGVRRIDDDSSAIYGTVGFQAPEVASDGPSVASDLYTVARTLAVLIFEFRGYQTTFETTLPGPADVAVFAEHDSLYRFLLRGTAPRPQDRFQTAEEMRDQLMGVLREVTAASAHGAVTASTPSRAFEAPGIPVDGVPWADLPELRTDPDDPQAAYLSSITAVDPQARLEALSAAPQRTMGVMLAEAHAALDGDDEQLAVAAINDALAADPWEWRAVWFQGLVALHADRPHDAIQAFNAVYGQIPGELAPKLALARACELGGEADIAARLYTVCARTDASYVAAGQFGLAHLAAAGGDRDAALAALEGIPTTSRAYGEARHQRALLLAGTADRPAGIDDLSAAAIELDRAALDPAQRQALHIRILQHALVEVQRHGPSTAVIAGSAADERSLRLALEQAWRDAARLERDPRQRWAMIDRANDARPRTPT